MKAVEGKPIQAGTAAVIMVILFFSVYPQTQAQEATVFTPQDRFAIPPYDGSIAFATNGSYASATLENDTWTFYDLTMSNSSRFGDLRVSVQNSDITIFSYYVGNLSQFSSRYALFRYYAEGAGVQTVNLGLNFSQSTEASEWGVILPGGVFLAEGRDWRLLPDNTVVLNGLTGNVTVAYYRFDTQDTSNLPFYVQHSVALATAAVVAVTVAVAGVISYRGRRRADGY